MKQTKKGSLMETISNIAIGYFLSFILNRFMHWFYDMEMSFSQNVGFGIAFTALSALRSYWVRRAYNHFGWFQVAEDVAEDPLVEEEFKEALNPRESLSCDLLKINSENCLLFEDNWYWASVVYGCDRKYEYCKKYETHMTNLDGGPIRVQVGFYYNNWE